MHPAISLLSEKEEVFFMPGTSSQALLPLLLVRGRAGSRGMLPPARCAVEGEGAAGAAAAPWCCLGQTVRNAAMFL